jgi:hypothetical protein
MWDKHMHIYRSPKHIISPQNRNFHSNSHTAARALAAVGGCGAAVDGYGGGISTAVRLLTAAAAAVLSTAATAASAARLCRGTVAKDFSRTLIRPTAARLTGLWRMLIKQPPQPRSTAARLLGIFPAAARPWRPPLHSRHNRATAVSISRPVGGAQYPRVRWRGLGPSRNLFRAGGALGVPKATTRVEDLTLCSWIPRRTRRLRKAEIPSVPGIGVHMVLLRPRRGERGGEPLR